MSRIVVGLSWSGASRRALIWAAQRSCESKSELIVVTALADPRAYGSMAGLHIPCVGTAVHELDAAHSQRLVIAEVLEGADLGSSLTTVVQIGRPSWVLLNRSLDADLLVLGAGKRRFGSTVRRCQKKSSCPVVVIELCSVTVG